MSAITPIYAFTIPSIADGTLLDCRIYHCQSLDDPPSDVQSWEKRCAVFAHPYAPLGGCMDDPLVMTVVEEFVNADYVVGTFNFRGAGASQGKTSWSSKAEQEDYISFAGLLLLYVQYLDTMRSEHSTRPDSSERTREAPCNSISTVLGGYSYGSLIVTKLPPTSELMQRFMDAPLNTLASEIVLRAKTLASETNKELEISRKQRGRQLHPRTSSTSSSHSHRPIIFGGEEGSPPRRNGSGSTGHRLSTDSVRKYVELPSRIKGHIRRHSSKSARVQTTENEMRLDNDHAPQIQGLDIQTHYLLVSPLLPPLSHALSPSMPSLSFGTKHEAMKTDILVQNPTLAIFGSADGFTSATKLRTWGQRMQTNSKALSPGRKAFQWHEVENAGHFWREQGCEEQLRLNITNWVKREVLHADLSDGLKDV